MTFIGLWLTVLAWGFLPGVADPFLAPRKCLFAIGAWGIILWCLLAKTPRQRWTNPALLWLCGWVGWRFLTSFWLPLITTPPKVADVLFNWYTLLPFLDFLTGVLLVYVLSTTILSVNSHAQTLTRWLCWVSTSVAAYTLLQACGADQFFSSQEVTWLTTGMENRMVATMGNVSYVAMFLGLTVPLFLCFRQRRYMVFLSVVLLSLFLMHKWYGLIAAAAGLLAYGWLRLYHRFPAFRKALYAFSVVSLVALDVVITSHSRMLFTNPRWHLWCLLWTLLKHRPLDGFGLGAFPMQFFVNWDAVKAGMPMGLKESRWLWAHNDLIQFAFDFGLIGAGLCVWTGWQALARGWKNTITSMGAGYFACAISLIVMLLMNFPWHFEPTVAVALIIWSMLETQQEEPVAWHPQRTRLPAWNLASES